MVSHPDVTRRLREFVCVRLDHNQMQVMAGGFASRTTIGGPPDLR